MVFSVKPKTEKFKVQNIPGAPEHVYFSEWDSWRISCCHTHPMRALPNSSTADFLGSRDEKVPNPITGSWFRIEQGPPATPPKYEYDEVGVVIEGG
ncbi:hypothetical protein CLCR_03211 [Cladophialophora carrionii]|uniref:Uncharacterized protein n=1 Tax=Cladophialophora carrionii TaxID=86049 RepID=A0A1C1D1R5_9EURO|nr:hypothetical protein CLCR_03211 [Cladophialophora carrionii]